MQSIPFRNSIEIIMFARITYHPNPKYLFITTNRLTFTKLMGLTFPKLGQYLQRQAIAIVLEFDHPFFDKCN